MFSSKHIQTSFTVGNDVIACESHSNGTESKYHNPCKTECQRIGLPIDH
jgi:hypothetical protein